MLQRLSGRELRRRILSPAIWSCPASSFLLRQADAGAKQKHLAAVQKHSHAISEGCITRFVFSCRFLSSCSQCQTPDSAIKICYCIYGRRRFSTAVAEQSLVSESPPSEALQRFLTITRICEIVEAHPWGDATANQIQALNALFTSDTVIRVIRAISSPSCSLSFFKWLGSTGYEHNLLSFGAMLDVLGQAGCTNDMKMLIGNIREAGLKLDVSLYDTLIGWLARHGDGMTALSLAEKMKEEGLAWSAATYTSVLNLYLKEGKYEKAVAAFLQMKEDSVVPDAETLSHLIRFLLEAGKLEPAQRIYSMLPALKMQPTQSMLAYLMAAYAKIGDLRMLKALGEEFRDICYHPGELLCVAFRSLQEEGMHAEADSLAREMWPDLTEEERKAKAQCVDNLSVSNAREEGKLKEQLEHLQCTDRKVNIAVADLVRLLESDGISVLEQVKVDWAADAVYRTLRQLKQPVLAWEFLKWVRSSPGYLHNVRNEVFVLRMLAKGSYFPALQELLLDLQSTTEFSLEIFNFLIKDCALVKNTGAAMWVYSRIKESNLIPDEETFSLLVQAFARGQHPDKASDLCFVMQDVGLEPDVETYTAVIHSLGLAGRSDDAWSYCQRMCAVGLKPNANTYTALLNAMNMAGNTALGIKIFEEMNSKGVSPSEATQGIMARIWEASGNITESQKLQAQRKFLFVKRREDSLQKIYENLLEGLVEQERSPSLLSFS